MHASIHPSIHPSTHPSIHVTHVIMRFGLANPFQQRDSPNVLQFRSTAVYTSTTVLCPWYGERSKVSNQIDAGKEEQTSTVSCSWDRLSLGKIFDRDSIILWPNSMEPCCVWHRYDCMASVLPIFVVRWSCAAGNPTSWVSWVDGCPISIGPMGFDRLWVLTVAAPVNRAVSPRNWQVRWRFDSHKSPRQGFSYCSWSIVEAWGSRTSYGYSSKWLTSQNWIPRTFAKDVQDLAEWRPTRPLATGHLLAASRAPALLQCGPTYPYISYMRSVDSVACWKYFRN